MNLSRCKHCGAIAHYAKSVTDPHLCWSIQCSDCGISTPSYSQQEMAAAAWERTAAAQKYGHRNGETEAPTTFVGILVPRRHYHFSDSHYVNDVVAH
jgi:hypothetical protein